jgi:hypothetical protein
MFSLIFTHSTGTCRITNSEKQTEDSTNEKPGHSLDTSSSEFESIGRFEPLNSDRVFSKNNLQKVPIGGPESGSHLSWRFRMMIGSWAGMPPNGGFINKRSERKAGDLTSFGHK